MTEATIHTRLQSTGEFGPACLSGPAHAAFQPEGETQEGKSPMAQAAAAIEIWLAGSD
jgi:hypothetical protein